MEDYAKLFMSSEVNKFAGIENDLITKARKGDVSAFAELIKFWKSKRDIFNSRAYKKYLMEA